MWNAAERYRDRSAELDVTSFAEQLALPAAQLDHDAAQGEPRPFDHVLAVKTQDLTAAHRPPFLAGGRREQSDTATIVALVSDRCRRRTLATS